MASSVVHSYSKQRFIFRTPAHGGDDPTVLRRIQKSPSEVFSVEYMTLLAIRLESVTLGLVMVRCLLIFIKWRLLGLL